MSPNKLERAADKIEKDLLGIPDRKKLKNEMKDSLPRIYNVLFPSVLSLAIDTRIILKDMKADFLEYMEKNAEHVREQRKLFDTYTNKLKNMVFRLNQAIDG